jgi:ABC-type sulfate/molybdate transport systems ATPase subunit
MNADAPHRDVKYNGHTALALHYVSVPFGTASGLHDITLSVASGERLALLGPSGAGKTSLLRAIAGLDTFSAGTLCINGVDKTHARPEQRGVVYLHQTPALFPHLTVRDNVAFPIRLRGANRASARAEATALLASLQLHTLADRYPERLSGGERHRTALARALAAHPQVLLLDEPFAALDPALRREIRSHVLDVLSAPGSPSAIVVTHDLDDATVFGNRIAVLLQGAIAQCDAAGTVVQQPATLAVARMLGVPNVVRGICTRESTSAGRWESAIGTAVGAWQPGAYAAVGWADMLAILPEGRQGASGVVQAVEHRGMGRVVRVQLHEQTVFGLSEPDATWMPGDRVTIALRTHTPHLVPFDV